MVSEKSGLVTLMKRFYSVASVVVNLKFPNKPASVLLLMANGLRDKRKLIFLLIF